MATINDFVGRDITRPRFRLSDGGVEGPRRPGAMEESDAPAPAPAKSQPPLRVQLRDLDEEEDAEDADVASWA